MFRHSVLIPESKCRTLSPIPGGSEGKGICLLVSSWLDLAGAAHQRWSCLCVGVGGRRRRAARRDDACVPDAVGPGLPALSSGPEGRGSHVRAGKMEAE